MKIRITKKQLEELNEDREFVLETGVRAFHDEYDDEIAKAKPKLNKAQIKNAQDVFADAFWQGYLYRAIVESSGRLAPKGEGETND